jgi:hypothetical protein
MWKVPILMIGATENNSYLEIRENDIISRFGIHESCVQREDFVSTKQIEWLYGMVLVFE